PIRRRGGVRVHAELAGQFPDRRQRVPGRQPAVRNGFFDVGGYGLRARSRYAVLYWHVSYYVLLQTAEATDGNRIPPHAAHHPHPLAGTRELRPRRSPSHPG